MALDAPDDGVAAAGVGGTTGFAADDDGMPTDNFVRLRALSPPPPPPRCPLARDGGRGTDAALSPEAVAVPDDDAAPSDGGNGIAPEALTATPALVVSAPSVRRFPSRVA